MRPDRTAFDSVRVGMHDSHVTPLYYVLGHVWVLLFGNSIAALRAMSAALGVGAIAAMFWFCRTLFGSSGAAWIAAALLASSPLMVAYSQEARAYSLWVVAILLCHTCFVRALQSRSRGNWLAYAVSVALSFYSHIFTLFVVAAHAAYIAIEAVWIEPRGRKKRLIEFSLASTIAAVLFSPWLFVIASNVSSVQNASSWLNVPIRKLDIVNSFVASISNLVIFSPNHHLPFWRNPDLSLAEQAIVSLVLLAFFAVVCSLAIALFSAWKSSPASCPDAPPDRDLTRASLLILCSILTVVFAFAIPSVLLGKTIGAIARYYFPLGVALQVGLAFCLWQQWRLAPKSWRISLWALLCAVSLASSHVAIAADTSWVKGDSGEAWDTIAAIQAVDRPIVVVPATNRINLMVLSYYLAPDTELLLVPNAREPNVALLKAQLTSGRNVLLLLERSGLERELASITGDEVRPLQERGNVLLFQFSL